MTERTNNLNVLFTTLILSELLKLLKLLMLLKLCFLTIFLFRPISF